MTVDQILLVLNWVLASGLPILIAFALRAESSSTLKAITNLVGSVLTTAVAAVVAALAAHHVPDWFTILFAAVTSFVVSAATYSHLWKPTGVAAAAYRVGNTGRHVAS